MIECYEILLNDNVWIFYPKCRDGLDDAIEEVATCIADGDDKDAFRIVYSKYKENTWKLEDSRSGAKLVQRYDVVNVDSFEVDETAYDNSESMDGDFDSAMTSAGFGTDEDYGCFGGEDY